MSINLVDVNLTGNQLFPTPFPVGPYAPRFTIEYVIERLVIGDDFPKLPRDHITNLWTPW